MKKRIAIITLITLFLVPTLLSNISIANAQTNYATTTIQSSGTITRQVTTNTTIILRSITITDLNPNTIDINKWVDSYVANHNYATAITIADMHQYGVWWFGYSFSATQGAWMGWTFNQLKQFIDAFHSHNWKVGLESTAIAWVNQEEYKYITTLHPELSFTNAEGNLAATINKGTNNIIPDPFAKFSTEDPINHIPIGTRLIDLYTTRLTQMIKEGLTWDFWFGTDGWNGLNLQGYTWTSANPANCNSFSDYEIDEWLSAMKVDTSQVSLGLNSVNTGLSNDFGANTKIESAFKCSSNGTITWLLAYLGANSPTNTQIAVYDGNQASPSKLLSSTDTVAVSTDGWYNFTLKIPVTVNEGNYYHFSLCTQGTVRVYNQYTGNTTGNAQTFGNFSNNFGATEKQGSFNSKSMDIYTQYTSASSWSERSTVQKASYILNSQLSSWSQYWQSRFAQEYAQIRQSFIAAGQSVASFHTIGSADLSSLSNTGNLSPYGMYNFSMLAQYNSFDYIYVDQESPSGGTLGQNQVAVGDHLKSINPALKPIIGLQPVNWLGSAANLATVEEEYSAQANDTATFSKNVIMMQYPSFEGWTGWTNSDVSSLINYINSFR